MYYVKGLLYSLGSVVVLYFAIRYLLPTKIVGWAYVLVYSLFHDPREPLKGTAGGSPYLLAHLWFWLVGMIVFACTFLVYLKRH